MKRLLPLSVFVAVPAVGGVALPAFAVAPVLAPPVTTPQPPGGCSDVLSLREYRIGFVLASRIVRESVAQVQDCRDIGSVPASVRAATASLLPLPLAPASLRASCRSIGALDGSLAELDNQNTVCSEACISTGALYGELAAQAYCLQSMASGGLEAPLVHQPANVCGAAYALECEQSFEAESKAFRLGPPVDEGCLPFTQGEFAEVWAQSRALQCLSPVD